MFIKLVLVHPWNQLRLPVTKILEIYYHAAGTGNTGTAQVYYCPSGITSGPANKIFDVDVQAGETVLLGIINCISQLVISL